MVGSGDCLNERSAFNKMCGKLLTSWRNDWIPRRYNTSLDKFVCLRNTSFYFYFPHSYRASWYYQSFIHSPTDALVSCLENNIKIYIKIYIKSAPTCFSVTVTTFLIIFHFRTVHFDNIKVSFIHQLMHQWFALKTILKITLKFILKQLRHVSV